MVPLYVVLSEQKNSRLSNVSSAKEPFIGFCNIFASDGSKPVEDKLELVLSKMSALTGFPSGTATGQYAKCKSDAEFNGKIFLLVFCFS